MKHTIYKLFFAWQHEEEENWLNQLSNKGFQLQQVRVGSYVFDEGTPGEFIYRIEFLENLPSHPESIAYIRFLEEIGVEHIATFFRWVYLRKKASLGEFDLYSDLDSRLKHFQRIRLLVIVIALANLPALFTNLLNFSRITDSSLLLIILLQLALIVLLGFGILRLSAKISRLNHEKMVRE